MKETASTTPRKWPNESLCNVSAVLSDDALTVWERLADGEPVLGDVVLADVRVVLARACLQNTGSALDLRLGRQVLKEDDVVRKMRDTDLRQARHTEELGHLLGHEHADRSPRKAL